MNIEHLGGPPPRKKQLETDDPNKAQTNKLTTNLILFPHTVLALWGSGGAYGLVDVTGLPEIWRSRKSTDFL